MPDNGFGAQGNSADALLRVYALKPDFKIWNGKATMGTGTVSPVSFRHGKRLPISRVMPLSTCATRITS